MQYSLTFKNNIGNIVFINIYYMPYGKTMEEFIDQLESLSTLA